MPIASKRTRAGFSLGEAGPKGLIGQRMESRRPTAANFFSALSPLRGALPEGEPAGLPVVSLIPRAFRQLVPHVPQNVHEQASPQGSWPEGPERAGIESRRPEAANFFSALSPLSRCSRGRACLTIIFLIYPGHILSISLICAICRTLRLYLHHHFRLVPA